MGMSRFSDIQENGRSRVRDLREKVLYNKFVRTGSNWNTCVGVEVFDRDDGEYKNSVVLLTVSGNQNADSRVVVELSDVDVESLRSIAQMISDASDVYAAKASAKNV